MANKKLSEIRQLFISKGGRPDLNRRPPEPQAPNYFIQNTKILPILFANAVFRCFKLIVVYTYLPFICIFMGKSWANRGQILKRINLNQI